MIDFFQKRQVQVVLLSEYGITNVDEPVHLNRLFRRNGWLTIKEELGLELIDFGASKAFAVADHQMAHVYINDRTIESKVREALEKEPGIAEVVDRKRQAESGIDHARSGDLIAVAKENSWFTYYYWLDDRLAPDFARCVDIHRKPGYDRWSNFFWTRRFPAVKLKIACASCCRRSSLPDVLMDVIPLDATTGERPAHGRTSARTRRIIPS